MSVTRIKIVPDARKPSVPKSQALIHEVDRVKNTGKPPLPLDKSFNKQGMKG